MSDCEEGSDDESETYEYPSDDESGDEREEAAIWERNVRVKETHVTPWMDADDQDFRLWGEKNSIRISIFSSLRQVVNSSCKKRILCSKDELFDDDLDIKTARIFLEVMDDMVVVYTLCFDSTKTLAASPPILKCVSYCGRGTYMFPNLLLPNCLSQFIDFGKVFDYLSRELVQYKPFFSSFLMVNEDSPYYMIQELAYMTQYRTSSVFDLEDSGIVTGVERDRKVKPGDGVGYSVTSHTAPDPPLKKDDSHQYKLTHLMNKICNVFHERILDSPLDELLGFMIRELSVEEVTQSPLYAEAIFKLFASLQDIYQKRSVEGEGFDHATLCKLATFKDILMDEYGLQNITLPEDILAAHRSSKAARRLSSPRNKSQSGERGKGAQAVGSEEGDTDINCDMDPVIFIDEVFTRHSYLSEATAASATGKAVLKRMKIEFNTLSTSLPPTIKYMVSEDNITLGKFLIVGPEDTPYEGGYFLFDLLLPANYPDSSPKVNFLTTGGGQVRFNPNLYNCGKVCLSLLGTWSGEKWDPSTSNINQVLQSICYLIFVDEPYFNEPGYKRNAGTLSQSQQYNRDTRRNTISAAYLDHLTHPDPYFGVIIRKMMEASWGKTKGVFERWASEDLGHHCGVIMGNIAAIEKKLLKNSSKNMKGSDAKKAK